MIDYNHFSKSVIGLVRKANEDSIGSISKEHSNGNGSIHIVCDGMGGHVGGATASQTAIKSITEFFKKRTYNDPIKALRQSIEFANSQIFSMAENDPSLRGMGTTIVILLIKEDKIYIAHVGDSRVYLFSDNTLYRLTKDHSFVQKLVDAGQIDENEAENHPRKNELTRALGISDTVQVEVTPNPILTKKGDKFLLCSDGLCGLVNDPTLANALKNTSLSETVNDLISLAENAGGHDNISVDLIEILKSTHKKSVFNNKGGKSIEMTATQVVDPSKFKKKSSLKLILVSLITLFVIGASGYYAYKEGLIINENNLEETITSKAEKVEEAEKKQEEAKKKLEETEKKLNNETDEEERKILEERLKKAEEEKRIADEERERAEEEKRIAEEERERAEEEKRIADEERERAEEEKRIADEEREKAVQKADLERERAEEEKEKAEEAKDERIEVEINNLIDKGYITKKFDWDQKKMSLYKDSKKIGKTFLYLYDEEDKIINNKYVEEWKRMQSFREDGWENIENNDKDKDYEYESFFDPTTIIGLRSNKLNKKDIEKILDNSNNKLGKKTTLRKKK